VKIYDIVPSVRSAMVEKGRISMVLELSCQEEASIQQGINYLTDLGFSVSHIYGDVMVS